MTPAEARQLCVAALRFYPVSYRDTATFPQQTLADAIEAGEMLLVQKKDIEELRERIHAAFGSQSHVRIIIDRLLSGGVE